MRIASTTLLSSVGGESTEFIRLLLCHPAANNSGDDFMHDIRTSGMHTLKAKALPLSLGPQTD
jgi:hypothetical protein